jgi:hypothetical protein
MGQAVWLYLWCLRHQTRRNGLVLGGTPLTYAYINQRLGQPERTVQRWVSLLRKLGYIEVSYLAYKKMRITVLKSKKFNFKQIPITFSTHPPKMADSPKDTHAKNGGYVPPKMADIDAKNGGFKQSGSLRSNETPEQEEEEATTTAEIKSAFDGIQTEPFGPWDFQGIFAHACHNGARSWVDAMERTIQQCKAEGIKVPGRFYKIKHVLEQLDAEQSFKKTPM